MKSRATLSWVRGALPIVLGGTILLAQPPQPAPAAPQDPPTPTFRAAVDAVQVDVFVTDEDGTAVPGLTADDFEVFENGALRPISSFEAVDIPLPDAQASSRLGEPDVVGNGGPLGRVYVFALDEVRPCNALRTRHFLRQFLDRHVGPDDIAAVALLGRGLVDSGQDFTANRRLLLQAIDRFTGGFPDGGKDECRPLGTHGAMAMESLRHLTEMMAKVEGRHKTLLLISEGITFDVHDIIDYQGGVLSTAAEHAHAALVAATRSNLTIYPIDPSGLTPERRPLGVRQNMAAIAEATGGFSLFDSNGYTAALSRIARESSTRYLIGFSSAYERYDGRYVRLDVQMKRPGLTAHARPGYVAPTREERSAELRSRGSQTPLTRAIASPIATRGVGLRASAAAYKGSGKEAAVSLVVEIDGSTLPLVEKNGRYTGLLELGYMATDARKRIHAGPRFSADLNLQPQTFARISSQGLRLVSQLALPPGRYQVRVAAAAASNSGSVLYDLEVPDFDDAPLAMSGISIAAIPAADVTTLRGDRVGGRRRPAVPCEPPQCAPGAGELGALSLWSTAATAAAEDAHLLQHVLPAPPTTAREFGTHQTLALFLEVYDNRRRRNGEIEVVTAVRDAADRVVHAVTERRAAGSGRNAAEAHGFTIHLPLGPVPPGSYALDVDARVAGTPASMPRRSLPFRVR